MVYPCGVVCWDKVTAEHRDHREDVDQGQWGPGLRATTCSSSLCLNRLGTPFLPDEC